MEALKRPDVRCLTRPPSSASNPAAWHACAISRPILFHSLACSRAANLKPAVGSYDKMPPVAILCHYLDDPEKRRAFVDSMAEVKVKQEEVIMRQGALISCVHTARSLSAHSLWLCILTAIVGSFSRAHAGDKGNNFYLIKAGSCDVWVADASGERQNVRTLTAGSWCGELSLLTGHSRSASDYGDVRGGLPP